MSIQFKKRSAPKGLKGKEETLEEADSTIVVKTEVKTVGQVSTIKQPVQESQIKGALVTAVFDSKREVTPFQYAGNATHTSDIDTSTERDARALLEKNIKLNQSGTLEAEKGIYHGQAGYKSYISKDMSTLATNKYSGTQGPLRAPSFVRSTSRFDYAPDICKDYKETGFCGYGDCCKFLHDRGDYKTGWQLEKEWDDEQAKKKKKLEERMRKFEQAELEAERRALTTGGSGGDSLTEAEQMEKLLKEGGGEEIGGAGESGSGAGEEDNEYFIPDDELDVGFYQDGEDEEEGYAGEGGTDEGEGGERKSRKRGVGGQAVDMDGLPFACYLCRGSFSNPVVTLCGHYFCGSCAIEKIGSGRDTSRGTGGSKGGGGGGICPICRKQTNGVFNKAWKLIKKLSAAGKLINSTSTPSVPLCPVISTPSSSSSQVRKSGWDEES